MRGVTGSGPGLRPTRRRGGESVVVGRSPRLKRVVVASGALGLGPRKSWAVSSTCSSWVLTWRYQTTGGLIAASPCAWYRLDEPVVGHVLGQRLPDPGVEGERARLDKGLVRLLRRIADHFIAKRSAYSGRSRRRSIQQARLSGSVPASSAATSAGAQGRMPQTSKNARRANSASVQGAPGMPSVRSLPKSGGSIRLCRPAAPTVRLPLQPGPWRVVDR